MEKKLRGATKGFANATSRAPQVPLINKSEQVFRETASRSGAWRAAGDCGPYHGVGATGRRGLRPLPLGWGHGGRQGTAAPTVGWGHGGRQGTAAPTMGLARGRQGTAAPTIGWGHGGRQGTAAPTVGWGRGGRSTWRNVREAFVAPRSLLTA